MTDNTETVTKPKASRARAAKLSPLEEAPSVPLIPGCPPRFVRQKSTGIVTRWSTLFKKNIGDFEVFYRVGTDERREHMVKLRRYEADSARYGANDAFDDSGFSTFGDDDFAGGDDDSF